MFICFCVCLCICFSVFLCIRCSVCLCILFSACVCVCVDVFVSMCACVLVSCFVWTLHLNISVYLGEINSFMRKKLSVSIYVDGCLVIIFLSDCCEDPWSFVSYVMCFSPHLFSPARERKRESWERGRGKRETQRKNRTGREIKYKI